MIPLRRLAEPSVLTEKRAEWEAKFEARRVKNPKARPESKQYAHGDVVATLESMSHRKCFYCEADGPMTVDHYIDVAERGDLAFTWENLYLACDGCQDKLPNKSIPVTDCVDPCDPTTNPADHLRFDGEYVLSRTPRGDATIRKYRLKRAQLESDRRRVLRRVSDELVERRTQAWEKMEPAERERILGYSQATAPFSRIVAAYLEKWGIREV